MNYMKCIICGKSYEYSDTYGESTCTHCGQAYEYDEGQMIKLSDEQIRMLNGASGEEETKEEVKAEEG